MVTQKTTAPGAGAAPIAQPGPPPAAAVTQLNSFDANDATFPASSPAAATSRNEHPLLAFDDTTAENVVFHGTMSRDYSGGDITVDVDWLAASAAVGDGVWGGQFERLAPGGQDYDADGFAAQQTATSTTNATSGIPNRTSLLFTNAQADLIAAGDRYRFRVQYVATDPGRTMVGDAQFSGLNMRQ